MIKPDALKKFPTSSGVYLFKDEGGTILYIGKATNLRSRVSSYFTGRDSRGERIFRMVEQADDVTFRQTDSVLEALILEANLIRKHRPKYNVDLKDDKSFSYFIVTKEPFPRIVIDHQTNLPKYQAKRVYGPYVSRRHMEIVLKILRRIFPFHASVQKTEKGCLYSQIGLCPGPYAGAIDRKGYAKNILGIEYVLRGQKRRLVSSLKKQMETASKKEDFELAADLRSKVTALEHIRDIALLSREDGSEANVHKTTRIEGYDISNISGEYAVGSMVVFTDGKPDKSQYRKFKIRTVEGSNDVAMMREVLARRIAHSEWPFPDLILLDGGKGHLNAIRQLFHELNVTVPLAGLAKGPTRKKLDLYVTNRSQAPSAILADIGLLEKVRDESHRFAIRYHRKVRSKGFLDTSEPDRS